MKHRLFILILCVAGFPVMVFSQLNVRMGAQKPVKYETVDTGILRIFYEAKIAMDAAKPDKTGTDYLVLDIGEKNISRFYSDNRRRMDSVMTEMLKKSPNQRDMRNALSDNGISSHGEQKEVFKNYPAGKLSVTDQIAMSDYLYEEGMKPMQWQIESDTREILSYSCQKAVTDFRGRHYEAWFAPDLPINDGPWKFAGLPGLILAVEDSDKNFSYLVIGIEKCTLPIQFPKKDYVKTSREEVRKIQKRFIDDPMGFLTNAAPGANIQIKMVDENGNETTGKEVKFPYNPMELE